MIRELNSEELFIIEDLARIIWPVSFKEMISKEQIDYMLNWMYNPQKLKENHANGHHYLLYTKGDEALGFVSYEIKAHKSTVRIHKLYVHYECQKKGIGKILLEHVKKIGLTEKITQIDLFVNRNNPAVGFYKFNGFYIDREIDLDIGHGYFMNDYLMKLKI